MKKNVIATICLMTNWGDINEIIKSLTVGGQGLEVIEEAG